MILDQRDSFEIRTCLSEAPSSRQRTGRPSQRPIRQPTRRLPKLALADRKTSTGQSTQRALLSYTGLAARDRRAARSSTAQAGRPHYRTARRPRPQIRDAGKPFRETADRDVPRAADNCAFFAGAIEHREQSVTFDRKTFLGKQREITSIVREEPLGVCALLTPWNSPRCKRLGRLRRRLRPGIRWC